MEEQFVPYELALKLKELGFDEECFKYWNCSYKTDDNSSILSMFKNEHIYSVAAPLWQQAFDWFREKHNMYFEIFQTPASSHWNICVYNLSSRFKTEKTYYNFISYEEARLECLRKLIELVEN